MGTLCLAACAIAWIALGQNLMCAVLADLLSDLFQAIPSSSSMCSCCVFYCHRHCYTLLPWKTPCLAILPPPTTPPTHMLPAVSLPKIAKPELTTMPALGDDSIPAQAMDARAPTKPDKEAAPTEEDGSL